MRVVIADDHEVVRKGVCNILKSRLNVEAIETANGKEAVEKARKLNPDHVIFRRGYVRPGRFFCS
jgi:DNA-binding NarL/FixJ family response regulator